MQDYLDQQANIVEDVLREHALPGRVAGGTLSPRLIHFALELPHGVRLATLTPALPTLAERLGVDAVRLAPDLETGRPTLEVPRPDPVPVRLLPLARSVADVAPPCAATIGQDVTGAPLLLRLDAPEVGPVLICGDRGSGKSALLRGMALSLALHNGPDTLRLLLIDVSGAAHRAPRGGAWAGLEALPHLVGDVAADAAEARLRLRWVQRLAERRAELAADGEPIEGENLVVLVDGLDALLNGPDGGELESTCRAIAAAGGLGIHFVAAGSNPDVGDLLPWGARLIGRLAHGAAATTAAGIRGTGAEGLLGRGDFLAVLGGDVVRLQAAHSTAAEAARTAALLGECAAGARDAASLNRALPEPSADSASIDRRKIWKAGQGALRLLRSG